MSRGVPQRDAACGEAGSERRQQRPFGQSLGPRAFEYEQHRGPRHISVVGENLPFVVERPLIERKCRLQRADDLGAAGMADEPVDVRHRQLHGCQNLGHGGVEMGGDEIGDGTAEDDTEAFRIDTPAHDAERVGPKVLAGILDPRHTAIAGAQYHRRCAVAEQADGNNVGLGEFVVAKRKRAELDRHQQHVGTRSRLCEARRDRQTRHAAGAAETKHRYAGDVGPEAHHASHTGFKTWRRDSGGADGHDGVDIAASEVGTCQRLLSDVDEQRLGTFEKRLGAFRPSSRLEIPVERLHDVTFDIPVLEKILAYLSNSGRRSRSESHVAARTSFCKNTWGGTDVARETSAAVGIARSLLPLQLWETSTRAVYSSAREDHRVESDTKT